MRIYQEPGTKHCSAACIATLLNIPLDEVLAVAKAVGADADTGLTITQEFLIFQYLGYEYNLVQVSAMTPQLIPGRTYLITVPSLNHVGGHHRILVKAGDLEDPTNPTKIHDPNRHSKHYSEDFLPVSWAEVVEFVNADFWEEN